MDQPTLLISDDDPALVSALARLARHNGLRVIEDRDGRALELVARERPALVLIDIHQGGLDGRDVLARLKAAPGTADVEVIVMSGSVEAWTRNECLALGALEFVPKPMPLEAMEVIARIAGAARDAQPRA